MPLSNPPKREQILDDSFWSDQLFQFATEIGAQEARPFTRWRCGLVIVSVRSRIADHSPNVVPATSRSTGP